MHLHCLFTPILFPILFSITCAALTPWEQIHQTLHTYPLAIDTKDFGLLSSVFTQDAFANYTGFLSNLTSLPAIQAGLTQSVAHLTTQHLLGTTSISIHQPRPQNETESQQAKSGTANSTTYFQATLFADPYAIGESATLFGFYRDVLREEECGWRIERRELVFQGPGMVGNLSILGG